MLAKKIPSVVIEDSEVDLWLITFMLKKTGLINILDVAKTGIEGLRLIEELKPDLVFLDLDLPEASGIEIARTVRSKNIITEIVFVTSFEQYKNEVREFEPLDYLVKPLSPEKLDTLLKKYKNKRT